MDAFEVPGLSVAIASAGKIAYVDAFGLADKDGKEVLTPNHLFRIASVTKPITSAAIMLLIQTGRIRLDSRIFGNDSILGADFPIPPDSRGLDDITVKHLLTHTAGGWANDAHDPMTLNEQMNHYELISWTLRNQLLKTQPGNVFAYSNFGYCLLGRVIEKVTGQPYDQHVMSSILDPVGISEMRIAGNTLADRASGEVRYYGQGGIDPYAVNVRRMDSNGGWIATPRDIVLFAMSIDGFSDRKQLLNAETLKIMTTASTANPRYAKGLMIDTEENWGHTGSLPGTETIMVRTHGDLCWAILANTRSKSPHAMASGMNSLGWHIISKVADWHR